jgi:hypothetical protein
MKKIEENETHFYVRLEHGLDNLSRKAVAFTLTPSKDPGFEGWEDVTYYGEGILDPTLSIKKPEWVYVLVNKSMPGICKIGMTTTSVPQRIKEINSATGVITPWFEVFKYKCINSHVLEKAVHLHLASRGHRVNDRREGFEISSKDAIQVIKELGEKLTVVPKDFKQ